MTWLNSLDISIKAALDCFPENVEIGTVQLPDQTYLISKQSLKNMQRMKLEALPVSTIALPYDNSEILTYKAQERLILDVSNQLCQFFPNFFVAAIYELQSLFSAYGLKAYIIGGITRDLVLSRKRRFDIQDVDITIMGDAIDAARSVDQQSKNFSLVQDFPPFGTAKLDYKDQIHLDFASTRQEIYTSCGSLPEVTDFGVPLEADITRRDFTVNALAFSIREPGKIIDCCGGLQDLEHHRIRLLKPESFFEDPTRIIRGIKFALRLGFEFSPDTLLLLDRFLPWMGQIYKGGGDRIREELRSLLNSPESESKAHWIRWFMDKGLYRLIDTQLPDGAMLPIDPDQLSSRLKSLQEKLGAIWSDELTWLVYTTFIFLSFPKIAGPDAMRRLELTREETEAIDLSYPLLDENLLYNLTPESSHSRLYEVFHSLPLSTVMVGLILCTDPENPIEAFRHYQQYLAHVKLEVTGNDILNLGVPQGSHVGQLLKALHQAKLEGLVHNRIEEMDWLKANI